MFKSRVLTSAIVVAAVAAASVFAAAPASAATLPAGQQITVVDYTEWQFSEANPETAALTPVGTGGLIPEGESLTAVDVNDDGQGYAFSTTYEEFVPEPCDPEEPECLPSFPSFDPVGAALHTADASTGTLGAGTPVQIVTGPLDEPVLADANECLALDYSDGVLLGACNTLDEGRSAWIGTIDPETAILTPLVLLSGEGFIRFQAIAVDPINGTIWGFDDDYSAAWNITLDNEEPDYIGTTEMAVYAADFDRGGQLWVSAYRYPEPEDRVIGPNEEGLATLDLTSGDFPFNAVWSDEEAQIDALTVWGKETLAVTGLTQSPAVALGAGALLLFGAILAAGTMAVRRRSAEN